MDGLDNTQWRSKTFTQLNGTEQQNKKKKKWHQSEKLIYAILLYIHIICIDRALFQCPSIAIEHAVVTNDGIQLDALT